LKLAICNELFENWELENVIAFCADLGYDGLEIAPFTLDPQPTKLPFRRRTELRQFAENHQLDLLGLHWLLANTKGLSITSANADTRKATKKYLCDLIDLCADLGGRKIIFGSPDQRRVEKKQKYKEAMKNVVRLFQNCMPWAENRDVIICFEPLPPIETNFVTTAAEGVKLVQAVGHPNFQLHLDVKAMSYEKKKIPEIIQESSDWLAHFHVNDKAGHEPGNSDIDFTPILTALHTVGYEEYVSVEAMDFTDGPKTIASRAYAYLSKIA
jgi:sugar phosphate isomerase/epimerase